MLFYITCIRSMLEYACPVFHRALPGYLREDLERLQKRALRIIYPDMLHNFQVCQPSLKGEKRFHQSSLMKS